MQEWWQERIASKIEAEILAENLLRNSGVVFNGQHLKIGSLPPETMGPILYVLSESFIESWEEDQEKAIVKTISTVNNWRYFIKVLERTSPTGKKVNAMNSLNRLNKILDAQQQDEFNSFIHSLLNKSQIVSTCQIEAWTTKDPVRWYSENGHSEKHEV